MKQHNININKLDIMNGLINCLVCENTILRKKQNNQQLTKEEEIFDTLLIPPSFLLRNISKLSRRKNEN